MKPDIAEVLPTTCAARQRKSAISIGEEQEHATCEFCAYHSTPILCPDSLRKGSVVYGLAVLTKLTRGHSHTNEEHCDNTIE